MKILSVGSFSRISNTSLHRNWALRKCASDFDQIDSDAAKISLKYRILHHLFLWGIPVRLPDESGVNQKIISYVGNKCYDVVWIDKGLTVAPETLKYIKEKSPNTKIVSYSPDNMALRHNQSQQYLECIPIYDYHFTTKSYILDAMRSLGAKKISFYNKLYESTYHKPLNLTEEEISKFREGGDVGFIGAWEKERCDSILFLCRNGIKVKVYGDSKWRSYKGTPNLSINPPLYSQEYSKALQAFKISLCFLRKMNKDQQTSRTMEIPACGGFMLAERTEEHKRLFEEDKEAAFFSSNEELLEKCKYYLAHDDERKAIAAAGNRRCETSGYSNELGIRNMLNEVMQQQEH